jgi:hypothetical protein
VPGVFFDRTGEVFFLLMTSMVQFAIFSTCMVLVWLGIAWVRYVFALYLLALGLFDVIYSIGLDAYGGGRLALGVIYLASGGALALSVDVVKYIEFRRRSGIPWVGLIVGLVVLWLLPLVVVAVDAGQAWMAYRQEQHDLDVATGMMQKIAPNLDVSVVRETAAKTLQDQLNDQGMVESFTDLKSGLGAFVKLDLPKGSSLASVSLHPPTGSVWTFYGTAHYAHGDAQLVLTEDTSQGDILFTSVYAQELNRKGRE